MLGITQGVIVNRSIRRVLVLSSLLVAAVPTTALEPAVGGTAASAVGQGRARGRIGERIQERRAQRGQREKETADETLQIAGLNVGVWRPSQKTGAPLIVFSHGFGGCHSQSTFLMEA